MSEFLLAIDTSEPSSKTGGTVPAFCAPLCFLKINITDEGAEHPPPPHPVWVAPTEQPEGALEPVLVIHLSCTTGDTCSEVAEHHPQPHPVWVAPAE